MSRFRIRERLRRTYWSLRKEERYRPFRIGVGFLTILLGILGLVLPILQGILFLVLGMSILAGESRRVRKVWTRICGWVGIRRGSSTLSEGSRPG